MGAALSDPRLLRHRCRTDADDVLLVLANGTGGRWRGRLNFIGRDTLFGRYWGCTEDHPFLHFELCYHQAIDWAIANGLPGSRPGRRANTSWRAAICRWKPIRCTLPIRAFATPCARYLAAERRAVAEEIEVLTAYGPFRRGDRLDCDAQD
jgi:uncharacterized protein